MMRPTASSASKTLDKPDSPPRQKTAPKAATKPKAPEGLATKAKKKVEEVAAKAKDVVTSDHQEDKHKEHHEEPETAPVVEPTADKAAEVETAPLHTEDSAAGAEGPAADAPADTEPEKTAVESETPKAQEEAVF